MAKKAKGKKRRKKKKVVVEDNKPQPPEGCVALLLTIKQMEDAGIFFIYAFI